jgi:hypothetical protein
MKMKNVSLISIFLSSTSMAQNIESNTVSEVVVRERPVGLYCHLTISNQSGVINEQDLNVTKALPNNRPLRERPDNTEYFNGVFLVGNDFSVKIKDDLASMETCQGIYNGLIKPPDKVQVCFESSLESQQPDSKFSDQYSSLWIDSSIGRSIRSEGPTRNYRGQDLARKASGQRIKFVESDNQIEKDGMTYLLTCRSL